MTDEKNSGAASGPVAIGRLVGNLADGGYIILRAGSGPRPVGPWDPVAAKAGPDLRDRLREQLTVLAEFGLREHVAVDGSTGTLTAAAAQLNRASRTAALTAAKEIETIVAQSAQAGFALEIVATGRVAADGWIVGVA